MLKSQMQGKEARTAEVCSIAPQCAARCGLGAEALTNTIYTAQLLFFLSVPRCTVMHLQMHSTATHLHSCSTPNNWGRLAGRPMVRNSYEYPTGHTAGEN